MNIILIYSILHITYIYISIIYITHYVLEPVDCKVGLFATVWFWNFVFVLSFFSYGRVYLMWGIWGHC